MTTVDSPVFGSITVETPVTEEVTTKKADLFKKVEKLVRPSASEKVKDTFDEEELPPERMTPPVSREDFQMHAVPMMRNRGIVANAVTDEREITYVIKYAANKLKVSSMEDFGRFLEDTAWNANRAGLPGGEVTGLAAYLRMSESIADDGGF